MQKNLKLENSVMYMKEIWIFLQNLPFQICSILVAIAKCSVEHANMLRIHILQPISQVFRLLRLQQSIRNK